MSTDNREDESQIDDSQLKLVMESIQEQFKSFNSFFQDMRKGLKEIKAAQRSNTTRARPSTTLTRFQTTKDEEVDNPNHYFRNLNNELEREQGRKNIDRYSFTKDEWMTSPRSCSSKEVYEDQCEKKKMSFVAVNKEKECKSKMSENMISKNKKKEGEGKEKRIQPLIVPLCKEVCLTIDDPNPSLPNVFVDPLQEFEVCDDQEKLPEIVTSTLREDESEASGSKELAKSEEKKEEEATGQTKQINSPLESETSRLKEQKSEKSKGEGKEATKDTKQINGPISSTSRDKYLTVEPIEEWVDQSEQVWFVNDDKVEVHPVTLDVWSSEEEEEAKTVSHMTRNGQIYQPEMIKPLEEKEKASSSSVPKTEIEDNALIKQMKRTHANIPVSLSISMADFMGIVQHDPLIITFSDDELPPEGRNHTKAPFIKAKNTIMVVKMMRWPWPPLSSRKFEVKVTIQRLEGLNMLQFDTENNHNDDVRNKRRLVVEIKWKGQKSIGWDL
ncbi:hypothetical protein JCGZ_05754 [Jatropha curcas]|uniref:Uncharacterized protein n=1 Tax=Jatropha curcas TaxID=180498 RepID=A0A067L2K7_JATCU|nr:hypothetical protein JCGZ_05754 [Jatropha curcas]